MSEDDQDAPAREPMLNAPWTALLAVGAILVSYAWQAWFGGGELAAIRHGFAPSDLDRGRWLGLVSMMFLHGGWPHAIMNALGVLAFGPPVARLFGTDLRGAAAFIGFYLTCGLLAGLGYAAFHLHESEQVVGASGAVAGLMGAASRLIGRREGLNAFTSRPVISLTLGWLAVNALMAVFGGGSLAQGASIAWEAHIAGFLAGLLLVEPWLRLAGGRVSR